MTNDPARHYGRKLYGVFPDGGRGDNMFGPYLSAEIAHAHCQSDWTTVVELEVTKVYKLNPVLTEVAKP